MTSLTVAFSVFFVVFCAISYKYKLYEIEYNKANIKHKISLALTVGLCLVASGMIFGILSTQSLEYPFKYVLSTMNAYEQQFDAFLKHQLNIDVVPNALLADLDNPYDWSERKMYMFDYLWDRVYYNNQYFSYFGIAPIILIYFPFYFISGKVPTAPTVCFILSVISIVAIAVLVYKLLKIFVKRINLPLLIFAILASETGSLLYMVQASADSYYIAVQSGITFLALFLMFTFCAYDNEKVLAKCIHFAFSGISLVFLVLSRPNLALYFLIAIPIYLSVIFSKEFKILEKLKQVFSFAVPTAIGAIFVMWYNYARFGSILEFGAQYQLTVYDVSKYSFNLSLLFPAFYYYFFQYPKFLEFAPYLDVPFYKMPNLTTYVYITSTIGILSFPSVWGVACIPVSLTSKKSDKTKKAILSIAILSVIFMAFFDMCFAGVNIRYLADIALISVVFTAVMLCEFFDLFYDNKKSVKFCVYVIISLLLALTFLLGVMLIFSNERDNIINFFKN